MPQVQRDGRVQYVGKRCNLLERDDFQNGNKLVAIISEVTIYIYIYMGGVTSYRPSLD